MQPQCCDPRRSTGSCARSGDGEGSWRPARAIGHNALTLRGMGQGGGTKRQRRRRLVAQARQNNKCAARAGTTTCLDVRAGCRRRCLACGGAINAGHEATFELMRMEGMGYAVMICDQVKIRRSGKMVSGRYRAVQGEREHGEYREPGRNTFRPVAHNQTLHLGTDSLIRILGH